MAFGYSIDGSIPVEAETGDALVAIRFGFAGEGLGPSIGIGDWLACGSALMSTGDQNIIVTAWSVQYDAASPPDLTMNPGGEDGVPWDGFGAQCIIVSVPGVDAEDLVGYSARDLSDDPIVLAFGELTIPSGGIGIIAVANWNATTWVDPSGFTNRMTQGWTEIAAWVRSTPGAIAPTVTTEGGYDWGAGLFLVFGPGGEEPEGSVVEFAGSASAAFAGSVVRAAAFNFGAAGALSASGASVRRGDVALSSSLVCAAVGAVALAASCALTVACSVLAGGASSVGASTALACTASVAFAGERIAASEVSLAAACTTALATRADVEATSALAASCTSALVVAAGTEGSTFTLSAEAEASLGASSSAESGASLSAGATCSPVSEALMGASCALSAACVAQGEGESVAACSAALAAPVGAAFAGERIAASEVSLAAACTTALATRADVEATSALNNPARPSPSRRPARPPWRVHPSRRRAPYSPPPVLSLVPPLG